jgi:hypothetical protein
MSQVNFYVLKDPKSNKNMSRDNVKKHIINGEYKSGDIFFVGNPERGPKYGFVTFKRPDIFHYGKPRFEKGPDFYYANALNKIQKFLKTIPIENKKARGVHYVSRKLAEFKNEEMGRNVSALLNDMRREEDSSFNYYINRINRVYRKIPDLLKNNKVLTVNDPRAFITNQIAPCHLRPRQDPAKYLENLRNQLRYVAKMYHQKKMKNSGFSKLFLSRLKSELGGRPCLENLIEGLSVALTDREFVWKGRSNNANPLVNGNGNGRYKQILMNAVTSFQGYLANNKESKNLPVSHQRRKNMFWNMIKNRNVVVRNNNGIQVYKKVKNYNINRRIFNNSSAANLLQYIARKNERTNEFKKQKKWVNEMERVHLQKKASEPIRGWPSKRQIEPIIEELKLIRTSNNKIKKMNELKSSSYSSQKKLIIIAEFILLQRDHAGIRLLFGSQIQTIITRIEFIGIQPGKELSPYARDVVDRLKKYKL